MNPAATMKTVLAWIALALITSSTVTAESQSVFDAGLPVESMPFPPFQENQFHDNVHRLQDLDRISARHGSSPKSNPFLQTHREQCELLRGHTPSIICLVTDSYGCRL
jgi:hypothetical protein